MNHYFDGLRASYFFFKAITSPFLMGTLLVSTDAKERGRIFLNLPLF